MPAEIKRGDIVKLANVADDGDDQPKALLRVLDINHDHGRVFCSVAPFDNPNTGATGSFFADELVIVPSASLPPTPRAMAREPVPPAIAHPSSPVIDARTRAEQAAQAAKEAADKAAAEKASADRKAAEEKAAADKAASEAAKNK